MIEILGIQIEAYFILPVIVFICIGVWNILKPILLKVVATKSKIKRMAFERSLTIMVDVEYKNGKRSETKHIFQRSKHIVTDLETLCGKSFWFDAENESYKFSKVTCSKCKSLMSNTDRSIAIWDT